MGFGLDLVSRFEFVDLWDKLLFFYNLLMFLLKDIYIVYIKY